MQTTSTFSSTNDLRLPQNDSAEPLNGFRLHRGERLVVTRRGNQTIYEVEEVQRGGCAAPMISALIVLLLIWAVVSGI